MTFQMVLMFSIQLQTLAQFKASSMKQMGSDAADRDFGGEVPLEAQVRKVGRRYLALRPTCCHLPS